VNWEKTVGRFAPVQSLIFLGFGVDSVLGRFFCPQVRWDAFISLVRKVLSLRRASARTVSRVCGKAISFGLALGPVPRLFTREMYRFVESCGSWDYVVALPEFVLTELSFWAGLQREWFTTDIWPVVRAVVANMAWSDAGAIGWGGWVRTVAGVEHEARGFLSVAERLLSSTHRELVGIMGVLESLVRFIEGSTVRMYTDSQAAWRICSVGSGKEHLQRLALSIFWFCVRHHIRLDLAWIPRELNVRADYLAGIYDRDDWMLSDEWFQYLDDRWGEHTIDRFATHLNFRVGRFNSRWWCPGCEDVDCFLLLNWRLENNWCNPPFGLIGRLLRLLREQRARATIILPQWEGRHWWPLICPSGVDQHGSPRWASFVIDSLELPSTSVEGAQLFSPGAGRGNDGTIGPPKFRVWAVRVTFA